MSETAVCEEEETHKQDVFIEDEEYILVIVQKLTTFNPWDDWEKVKEYDDNSHVTED